MWPFLCENLSIRVKKKRLSQIISQYCEKEEKIYKKIQIQKWGAFFGRLKRQLPRKDTFNKKYQNVYDLK